ncbi:MAG: hypothetical protein ACI392_01190 [Paludibacteraceae bacterium]
MMKRIALIVMTICCIGTMAADNADLKRAAELYAAQSYDEAAQIYEEILSEGGIAPELYYNYANACYKSNKIGLAVLYYERALALRPDYEDARFNLEFVNRQITDKIEPIQPFFLTTWITAVGRIMSSNAWAITGITLFCTALILALVYVFGKRRWLRQTAFFCALFALICSGCATAYSFAAKQHLEERSEAVVMVGATTVKSAPDDSGTELFVLHEGTKVSIKSTFADSWVEIRIADGHVGWLKATDIERI